MPISNLIVKPLLAGILILLIFALAGYIEYDKNFKEDQKKLKEKAELTLITLESAITFRMINLQSLLTYTLIHGSFSQSEFNQFAKTLYDPTSDIVRGVTYLTETTITHTYPLETNKAAIGVNLALIEEQKKDVLYVKNERKSVFAGPIKLVQGGNAFVCRSPAILEDKYLGQFSVVFDYDKLLDYIGIIMLAKSNYVEFTINTPGISEPKLVFSNFDNSKLNNIIARAEILGSDVILRIYPKSGFSGFSVQLAFIVVSALILGVIVFFLVFNNYRFQASLTESNLGLESSLQQLRMREEQLRDQYEEIKKGQESLRKSKEFRKRVFENSRMPIVVMDAITLIFLDCNPAAIEILGYSTKEETLGKTPMDNSPEFQYDGAPSEEKAKEFIRQALENTSIVFEWINKRPNGELWDAEVHLLSFSIEGRKMLQFSLIDITERKQMDQERQQKALLEKKIAIAEESLKFKQNFLANMSHEIRTPLTGVLGMIEILQKTPLTENQKDYLNTIKTSGENLREIINQVLDYSKIEAGKLSINPHVFEFKSLPENTMLLYTNSIKQSVTLHNSIDSEIPAFIQADHSRLAQILNNFVSNAVKFTSHGSIKIVSSLISKDVSQNLVNIRIEISDTGIGIPEDLQKKLFIPFSQIEAMDTRHYEGTGLGLSICKQLIEMMGGQIGLISEVGKGSTFWFTFPAKIAQAPEKLIIKEPESAPNKALKILLAEDKAVNQKVISLLLNSMGHEVEIAANGQQALDCFEPGKFDLILMDIQMPVMDGITATQKLKETHTHLPPIVGLSANAFEGDREKYMEQGMDDYLTKPFKTEDFEELVNRLF